MHPVVTAPPSTCAASLPLLLAGQASERDALPAVRDRWVGGCAMRGSSTGAMSRACLCADRAAAAAAVVSLLPTPCCRCHVPPACPRAPARSLPVAPLPHHCRCRCVQSPAGRKISTTCPWRLTKTAPSPAACATSGGGRGRAGGGGQRGLPVLLAVRCQAGGRLAWPRLALLPPPPSNAFNRCCYACLSTRPQPSPSAAALPCLPAAQQRRWRGRRSSFATSADACRRRRWGRPLLLAPTCQPCAGPPKPVCRLRARVRLAEGGCRKLRSPRLSAQKRCPLPNPIRPAAEAHAAGAAAPGALPAPQALQIHREHRAVRGWVGGGRHGGQQCRWQPVAKQGGLEGAGRGAGSPPPSLRFCAGLTLKPPCRTPALPCVACCRLKKLMHRVTFPWELKMINTTDDCPDAGGWVGGRAGGCGLQLLLLSAAAADAPSRCRCRCCCRRCTSQTLPTCPFPLQTRLTSCLLWWCTWGRTQTTVSGCRRSGARPRRPATPLAVSACSSLAVHVPAPQQHNVCAPGASPPSHLSRRPAGHYVALVRTPGGQWVCFDDEQVNAVTEAQARG